MDGGVVQHSAEAWQRDEESHLTWNPGELEGVLHSPWQNAPHDDFVALDTCLRCSIIPYKSFLPCKLFDGAQDLNTIIFIVTRSAFERKLVDLLLHAGSSAAPHPQKDGTNANAQQIHCDEQAKNQALRRFRRVRWVQLFQVCGKEQQLRDP